MCVGAWGGGSRKVVLFIIGLLKCFAEIPDSVGN